MYSAQATALLILDAQNRTKAVPENLDSEFTYVAGWCYWYKGASLVKEFAYSCLELLTKEKLNLILKELGLSVAKSAAKEEVIKVLKQVKITELRAILTKKIMPDFELSVVAFEKLFRISTANRRRLQELDDALPITRWGESKYGQYPIFSLVKVLEILHADKTLLKQFYDYVEEKLTAKAKQIAREKEIELSFKDKYLARVVEHSELESNNIKKLVKEEKFRSAYNILSNLIQQKERNARDMAIELSFQNDFLEKSTKYSELAKEDSIQRLIKDGKYKAACNSLNQLIQKQEKIERQKALEFSFRDKFLQKSAEYPEFAKRNNVRNLFLDEKYQAAYNTLIELIKEQEKIERLHQRYLTLCEELGRIPETLNSINLLNIAIKELEATRKALNNTAIMGGLAKSLDNLLQNEVEIFTQTSNHQFQYSKELQSDKKALKFCQSVLSGRGICVENQLRWKNINNVPQTIADYEDIIFSHPVLLQMQGVSELA